MIAATLHGRLKFGILPSWAFDITLGADERIDAEESRHDCHPW
jgi:hypothetical protein